MTWKSQQIEIDARPALILVDMRFSARAPMPELPRLCWLGVWNARPSQGAFWDPDESSALDGFENDLLGVAQQLGHGWAAYVLRICTSGMREFYFYAGAGAKFGRLEPAIRAMQPHYRLEYEEKRDPTWEVYRRYASAAG